jgi:hypothetical protein
MKEKTIEFLQKIGIAVGVIIIILLIIFTINAWL